MHSRIGIVTLLIFLTIGIRAQFDPDIDQSVKLTANVNAANSSITINWIVDDRATGFDLYRRIHGESNWGTKIGQYTIDVNSYSDTDIQLNTLYEYKIQKYTEEGVDGFGYILTGIEMQPAHNPEKALLVITQTTHLNVASQVSEFQEILTLDGWSNRLLIIPDGLLVSEVRDAILDEYDSEPFSTCILLGDVPIPLSGDVAPDGHTPQGGAWAADLYYGDIDGIWTDSIVNNTISPWPVNNNVPNDGKWDQSTIPSDIEIAIGRIDFSNLPVFEEDEYELLSQYLEKNIAYRTGQKEVRRRAAIYNINPWIGALGQNGIRNFSTIVGPDSILYDNFSPLWEESYMWLYAASSGFHDLLNLVTTSQELSNRPLKAVFTNFFGSRFGNYDYENNFMRSALGSGDVLSSCWVGAPHWYFHSMAMGYSLGHATITTQNNDTIYSSGNNVKSIHVNLLGDPTLRLFPMKKVNALSAVENPAYIELNWASTTDAEGYFVYRRGIDETDFSLLNDEAITGTTYRDYCPMIGQTYVYMIRASRLELTPSGSYYNLSTGVMDTITSVLAHSPIAAFDLFVNDDQWFLVDESENADSIAIIGAQHTDLFDGTYFLDEVENGDLITLIATNACGADTITQEIVISAIKKEKENSSISVFPNPVSSTLNIYSFESIVHWKLMSYNGALIMDRINESNEVIIDVSDLSSGVYFLVLSTVNRDIPKRIFIE